MSDLLKKFKVNDRFLGQYQKLVIEDVIPYQEAALRDEIPDAEKSHAIENFKQAAQKLKTGKCEEEFYGMVFQDSDVAKWLEAAAYSLVAKTDENLEKRMDDMIAIIKDSQHEDGYLNTYFTVKEPDRRWTDLQEAHELYCAGHMMEAAVAYYEATGKTSLLEIMKKMADHIYRHFIEEKAEGYPGHPEVELALMRMYRTTGDERYKELAVHFVNVRGVDSDYFKRESKTRGWTVWNMNPDDREYAQNQAPVREQKDATGHAVRAVYLYTAMADIAATDGDETLVQACEQLWDSITKKRMYVTGGIGSTNIGEAFTKDYHLPNDTAYAETCASIGLMFFARKMLDIHMNGEYADVMERAFYNTVLAGMQLDGKRFFYVNPLEVIPRVSGEAVTHKHDLPIRPKWFGCACCPPNVARTITSIGEYAWSENKNTVFSHLYMGGELDLSSTKGAKICVKTDYPYDGNVEYSMKEIQGTAEFTLAVRIPNWCKDIKVFLNGKDIYDTEKVEKGYFYVTKSFVNEDVLKVVFDIQPVKVYSNVAVAATSGMVSVMRGPLVYCAEGADNEGDVLGLTIKENGSMTALDYDKDLLSGIVKLKVQGYRTGSNKELYTTEKPEKKPVEITMVPYYTWGNRGLNEMRVWIPEK